MQETFPTTQVRSSPVASSHISQVGLPLANTLSPSECAPARQIHQGKAMLNRTSLQAQPYLKTAPRWAGPLQLPQKHLQSVIALCCHSYLNPIYMLIFLFFSFAFASITMQLHLTLSFPHGAMLPAHDWLIILLFFFSFSNPKSTCTDSSYPQ